MLAGLPAGCGGDATRVDWAVPQTIPLGGAERCGPTEQRIRLDLRRLVLERHRWSVSGSFVNDSDAPLGILRPHTHAGTYFGLAVFRTTDHAEIERRARELRLHVQLIADAFRPPLPRPMPPHAGWNGTFSGPGRLPSGRHVRVVLGRFLASGHGPQVGFTCISERAARIP